MGAMHVDLTTDELAWVVRWVAGEPPFGPGYGREGVVGRFLEWRRNL